MSDEFEANLGKELADADRVVILGVGNELRGDDYLGLAVARELEKAISSEKYQVIVAWSAPENFTREIKEASPSLVLFIDSADMGKEPGCIEIIEKDRIANITFSTHNLPLSILADYLTSEVGCRVVIVGIQPDLGGGSSGVEEAVERLAAVLC